MLFDVQEFEPLTAAEQKLVEAAARGAACEFLGADGRGVGGSVGSDGDGHIRAAVLRALLSGPGNPWGVDAGTPIDVRGAVISGRLGGFQGAELPQIRLESCRFDDDVDFGGAVFAGEVRMVSSTFEKCATFTEAIFAGSAWFDGVAFTGDARFDGAIFTGKAQFDRASFRGDAWFDDATFTADATFERASFSGEAYFRQAVARHISFLRAVFVQPDPGPWVAATVSLEKAQLMVRGRISVTAKEVNASRLQAREGAYLALHCDRVDLSASELLRGSIFTSSPSMEVMPARNTMAEAHLGSTAKSATAAADRFRNDLSGELSTLQSRCRLTSLARADIRGLVISDVALDDCEFALAHGLDELRIGAGCSFQHTSGLWHWPPMIRRTVIAEELDWRRHHRGRRDDTSRGGFVPAPEIASIYRDLRKGMEDAKNEPGAADFYYGEMEMRRLAGRKPTGLVDAMQLPSSWVERAVLYVYWIVSGYSSRSSRALLTLALVIFSAALLYTAPGFATVTPPPAQIATIDPTNGQVTYTSPPPPMRPTFATALDYAARESVSLLEGSGTSLITTKWPGDLVNAIVRLAGPVLLAFAIFALRSRTKR
jgi:uncharacterized protein YjbI with pentapeptide repeats